MLFFQGDANAVRLCGRQCESEQSVASPGDLVNGSSCKFASHSGFGDAEHWQRRQPELHVQVFECKWDNYLSLVYALINGSLSVSGGCVSYYVPAGKALYLFNDSGSGVAGPLAPGAAGSLSNSQCMISGPGSSAIGSGNTLSLTLAVVFNASFKGTQTLFGYAADNANLNSGWQALGTWSTGAVINSPPTLDSVTPSTGSGGRQNFTFKYSSVNGNNYLSLGYALINGSLSVAAGCVSY